MTNIVLVISPQGTLNLDKIYEAIPFIQWKTDSAGM